MHPIDADCTDSQHSKQLEESRLQLQHEHTQTPLQLASLLQTDLAGGLDRTEVERRWQLFGHNELKGDDGIVWWRIIIAQLLNALTLILLFAVVSYIECLKHL
jgi:magnesium-transporting ATPase (P-type)